MSDNTPTRERPKHIEEWAWCKYHLSYRNFRHQKRCQYAWGEPSFGPCWFEEESSMSDNTPTCPHGSTGPHTIQRELEGGIILEIICNGPATNIST